MNDIWRSMLSHLQGFDLPRYRLGSKLAARCLEYNRIWINIVVGWMKNRELIEIPELDLLLVEAWTLDRWETR